jgi:hypothetical protein
MRTGTLSFLFTVVFTEITTVPWPEGCSGKMSCCCELGIHCGKVKLHPYLTPLIKMSFR